MNTGAVSRRKSTCARN